MRAVAIVAVALVLAGCGSSTGSEQAQPSSSTDTTGKCAQLADAAFTPRLSPALQNRETMYLTDVQPETNMCTDRVVFTFEDAKPGPGFEVSYEPADRAKVEDGSGKPVEIQGSAFLVVRLSPAMTARISGDQVEPTYTGPRRITPEGFSFVREVVKTGDFESIVTWVIGLETKRPFTATASETQLVVEIG